MLSLGHNELIYVNHLHKVMKNAFLILYAKNNNLFYTGHDKVWNYENHHVMTCIANRVNATFIPDNSDHV